MMELQIKAFIDQFPFLTNGNKPFIRNIEEVDSLTVSPIDEALLRKKPMYNEARSSFGIITDAERIHLFDGDGNILTEVEQSGYLSKSEECQDDEEWSGETVNEALLRTNPEKVYYAVVVHTGYKIEKHRSVGGYSVAVYTLPNGFKLSGLR